MSIDLAREPPYAPCMSRNGQACNVAPPDLWFFRAFGLAFLLLFSLPPLANAQFQFTTNTDGTLTITAYTGNDVEVSIPDAINGLPVTCIASSEVGILGYN